MKLLVEKCCFFLCIFNPKTVIGSVTQSVTEGDGTVKSKEVQHAEKIYATLRECREQSGVKKNKGK